MKEGIYLDYSDRDWDEGDDPAVCYRCTGITEKEFGWPEKAFAYLIDKVSGKGTWESNPYVFVYDFELIKYIHMPIKDKSRYPSDWKQIRQRILERAGHCCEFCGVENYTMRWNGKKFVRIVLTIAHLDNVPEHCGEDNLRALCQKCHLTYDAGFHAANARLTRLAKQAARTDGRI